MRLAAIEKIFAYQFDTMTSRKNLQKWDRNWIRSTFSCL